MVIMVFRVTVVLCGSLQQLFSSSCRIFESSIVLGMIQSTTILDQLLNEEVIRDYAFKLAKHAKNSLKWIASFFWVYMLMICSLKGYVYKATDQLLRLMFPS